MRNKLIAWSMLSMLFWSAFPAAAQVRVGIGLPAVSIGINVPTYPQLVPVPGYPVYYAPGVNTNYFFYDGAYWVYESDNWYASSWYNGPWSFVEPAVVPVYLLRVPVRYYRRAPTYFRGWRADAAPHWGEHWGRDWEQRRVGWDRWNRHSGPSLAPLPGYQRQYSGNRYPQAEEQSGLHGQYYRHQPRDEVVQHYYREQGVQPVPSDRIRRVDPPQTQQVPAPVGRGNRVEAPTRTPGQQPGANRGARGKEAGQD